MTWDTPALTKAWWNIRFINFQAFFRLGKAKMALNLTWVVTRETASRRLYWFLLAVVHSPPSILRYQSFSILISKRNQSKKEAIKWLQVNLMKQIYTPIIYYVNSELTQPPKKSSHQGANSELYPQCFQTQSQWMLCSQHPSQLCQGRFHHQ